MIEGQELQKNIIKEGAKSQIEAIKILSQVNFKFNKLVKALKYLSDHGLVFMYFKNK